MAAGQVSFIRNKGNRMKRRQRGVTLVELMVVCVVVGILVAIAIPSYRRYMIRVNRTSAKTLLLQTAMAMERCYTNSTPYAYDSATCVANVVRPLTSPDGNYVVANAAAPTPTTFSLSATPQGAQATDAACGTFGIDQTGQRTITGTATLTECWGK